MLLFDETSLYTNNKYFPMSKKDLIFEQIRKQRYIYRNYDDESTLGSPNHEKKGANVIRFIDIEKF